MTTEKKKIKEDPINKSNQFFYTFRQPVRTSVSQVKSESILLYYSIKNSKVI